MPKKPSPEGFELRLKLMTAITDRIDDLDLSSERVSELLGLHPGRVNALLEHRPSFSTTELIRHAYTMGLRVEFTITERERQSA
ncbi:helix-turn-helix DNA binding domain protein [Rhodococcus phage Finch]|uniref:Helix-turn-helix DNA binding domain protein n=1 Tax=Rhodococcus phage Finch TaxID=2094144 RepID=A0A2P1JXM2_9CAUD|nr:helix-turn-helix DNA binding domain protein [Rhodococcus phage Finch]AVO25079.1 helix-turn-helix DNA binding domain protein [Rhodococcus phage Finch]